MRTSFALIYLSLQSQHRLPRQLNLPRRFSLLPPPFTNTYRASFSQFDFVFDSRERARAVVWEMYAG